MGASSTGGILLVGCLSLLGWCYLSAVPLGCLSAAAFLWAGTSLRCVAASHRRFGRCAPAVEPFCALITSGPAPAAGGPRRAGKMQIPQAWGGLESAPRSPREGICLQPSAKCCRRSPASSVLSAAHSCCRRSQGAAGSHKTRPKRSGSLFSLSGATTASGHRPAKKAQSSAPAAPRA